MNKANVVNYARNGSHCPLSSHAFAGSVAAGISAAVEAYKGATLDVGAYTPPYDAGFTPGGFLTLTFLSGDLPEACVGIEFGQKDEAGQPLREDFNLEGWHADQRNPHAAGIYAINFDEAWRIVCIVATYIEAQRVTLSYGC